MAQAGGLAAERGHRPAQLVFHLGNAGAGFGVKGCRRFLSLLPHGADNVQTLPVLIVDEQDAGDEQGAVR